MSSKRKRDGSASGMKAGVAPAAASATPLPALPTSLADLTETLSSPGTPDLSLIISSAMPPVKPTKNSAKNVPAFLNKLYAMVSDSSTDDLIHWSEDGQAFIVTRHEDFARDVLPRFFKHNNFSSFVRQLNMYGFHKIPHVQQGALLTGEESEMWEFANSNFQKNQPDLLCLVTRKRGRDGDEKDGQIDVGGFIQELSAIKRHQLAISADFKSIQRENQVLWTEFMSLRERNQRQQETIDKIVRFLATVFTSKSKPTITKKRRLLLEDGSDPADGRDAVQGENSAGGPFRIYNLLKVEIEISPVRGDDDLDLVQQRVMELANVFSANDSLFSATLAKTPIDPPSGLLSSTASTDAAGVDLSLVQDRINVLDDHLNNVLQDPFIIDEILDSGNEESFLSFINSQQSQPNLSLPTLLDGGGAQGQSAVSLPPQSEPDFDLLFK